jgi:hypothetical protein
MKCDFLINIQMPDTFNIPKKYAATHLKEGDRYILTAYFTDPNTICSGDRATKAGYVGDKLFLVMNNGPVEIPLEESGIDAAKPAQQWTKGKCFFGMGKRTLRSILCIRFTFFPIQNEVKRTTLIT